MTTSASRIAAGIFILMMGGCSVVLGIDNEYYAQGGDGGGGETGASSSGSGSSAEVSASSAASSSGGDPGGAGGAGSGAGGGAGGGPIDPCGNGIIDPGEECDDKNDASNMYCVECQVDCQDGVEHPTTHHCYINSGKDGPGPGGGSLASWTEAKALCEALSAGAHLATLTTSAEISFVVNAFLGGNSAWIGATDMALEGSFAWITGEPWTFSPNGGPWDGNEPNGSGDCLQVRTNPGDAGEFDDSACNNDIAFFCEIPPAGAAP